MSKKVTQMTELLSIDDNDLLHVVDDSETTLSNKNKKLKASTLKDYVKSGSDIITFEQNASNYNLKRIIFPDGSITVKILIKDSKVAIPSLDIVPQGLAQFYQFDDLYSTTLSVINNSASIPSPTVTFNNLIETGVPEVFAMQGLLGYTQTAQYDNSNDPGSPAYNGYSLPDISSSSGGAITFTLVPPSPSASEATRLIVLKGVLIGDDV